MSTHANMVKMTTATTGTGTITLGSASSGFQSFADAYGANATVDVLITDGAAWEVARNCAYDNSAGTVTRGTWEDSSNGTGAITLTGNAVVSVVATAELGNKLDTVLKSVTPGGRLTLESGVPVSTTDQTAKTSIYYTPYVHNIINLWDDAEWKPITFTEYTLALGTLTSGKNYDVFAYLSSGVLALEMLVWTNDSTRATAVTLQDGRYCKSGAKDRLYLGTFRTTSTTTTADALATRYLWNFYNRCRRNAYGSSSTAHTYTTTTNREWNAGTGMTRAQLVVGLVEEICDLGLWAVIDRGTVGQYGWIYIGFNSTTVAVSDADSSAPGTSSMTGTYYAAFANTSKQTPALGLNYATVLEYGIPGVNYNSCRITVGVQG